MKNFELQLEDIVVTGLENFCDETGFTTEKLVTLLATNQHLQNQIKLEELNKGKLNKKSNNFKYLKEFSPDDVAKRLEKENAYILAYIFINMEETMAATILAKLSVAKQVEVVNFIANGICNNSGLKDGIEKYLESVMSGANNDSCMWDNISTLVDIISLMPGSKTGNLLDSLDEGLRNKIIKNIFVFEDIVLLDDRAMQKVLRETDAIVIAKALKNASKETADKIFRNMSKRAASMLIEDIEFMGPVRLKDVEEAQQFIVAVIRALETRGEIIIRRTAEDELIDSPDWISDYTLDFESEDIDLEEDESSDKTDN